MQLALIMVVCNMVGIRIGEAANPGPRDRVVFETLNGRTRKAAEDYVASSACRADAVCLQEVSVAGDQARSLEGRFKSRGWVLAANDSEVSHGMSKDGISAGTAIGARKHWGSCAVPGMTSTVVVEHRISLMHRMALVKGGVDLASVYLVSGEGLPQKTWSTWSSWARS